MAQLILFGDPPANKVVNVASIPQRSPFRYPGGKTWLIPQIRLWLDSLPNKPSYFVEPFAGGGIVALTVAAEVLAKRVIMVEIDSEVAAVWNTIFNDEGGAVWLARKIGDFVMTLTNVQETLSKSPRSTREKAFQTILRNRVYHGGILAPGSGLIKNGEKGKGISSRWYPQTLQRRIYSIIEYSQCITFIEGDGNKIIDAMADERDAVFFIDPPYTGGDKKAGARLYNHYELDHDNLFHLTSRLSGSFLMTYDNDPAVIQLAMKHCFRCKPISMQNTHLQKMTELLISRDLSWS